MPDTDAASAPTLTRRWPKRVGIAAGALVGALVLNAAVLWFRFDTDGGTMPGSPPGGQTWLLIGSDRRGNVPDDDLDRFGTPADAPGARADVIVAIRVADDGTVRTLGIPRDLLLVRPRAGLERLATMLQYGPGAIAGALCHSIGLGADHMAMVEFDGLRDLVDLVGGVELTSDAKLLDRKSGLLLKDGTSTVDGRMALAYVRARTIEVWDGERWVPDLPRSNERPERAVTVIRQLARRVDIDWTNPWKMERLAWVGTGAVTVDDDTGPFDLLDLSDAIAGRARGQSSTLPGRVRVGPGADLVPQQEVVPATFAAVDDFQGSRRPAACATPALDTPGG